MNIGISNTQVAWNRTRYGFLIAAAGVLLAASAAIAVVSLTGGDGKAESLRAVPQSIPQSFTPAQTFIYIVGSETEAQAMQAAFLEVADSSEVNRHVIVVDSPESEASFALWQQELMLDATNASRTTVIDARQ
jgi:hypothetical protein